MFAIGHFALGYITGKASSRLLKTKLNLPLLFAFSVIPDIDLILQFIDPTLFMHRGPTHSILTYTIIMIPFLVIYGKKVLPYYLVLLSHPLLGDFFTGGFEMLWPISTGWFGTSSIEVMGLTNSVIELTLFVLVLLLMLRTKDLQSLLKPNNHNLLLIIAFGAVLGPMLQLGQSIEMFLPPLLIIPSIFYLCLFGYSMLIELHSKLSEPHPLHN